MKNNKRFFLINMALIAGVLILAIIPFFVAGDGSFAGADDTAKKIVSQMRPDYRPWFSPLWEPPSPEVASLLFVFQGALGAGFVGYYIGYQRGKRKGQDS